ncbi:uncharacterized protein LOC143889877 isoform X1 [Tasmannia lanceolata]|uniref:uncharacterized protein LOC143889877 isoform X1 n=1 Tax=Tasmannia lanceolata TaxID=3420 RepID=UPI004062D328
MESKDMVQVEAKDNVEVARLAIQELIKDHNTDEESLLLSRLLSQLESLKEDTTEQTENSTVTKEPTSLDEVEVGVKDESQGHESSGMGAEDIVRELRKVKRQNTITHCLLSVMIVITAVWQFSEVSLLLGVKNTVSNPFRAIGSVITGVLRSGQIRNQADAERSPSLPKLPQVDAPPLPVHLVPGLPQGGRGVNVNLFFIL